MQAAFLGRRLPTALVSLALVTLCVATPSAAQQEADDAGAAYAPPAPPPPPEPLPGADAVPPPPPSGYGDASPPAPGGTALYPAPGGTTPVPPPGASSAGYPAAPAGNNVVQQAAEPTRVRYHGGPIPAGAYIESSRRPGLYIPGLVIFGLAYASAVYDALVYPGLPNTQYLAIPVLGPIIYGSREQSVTPYMVMNSLMQAAGLALFIAGFPKKDFLVIPAGTQYQVAFSPMVGRGSFGLGITVH